MRKKSNYTYKKSKAKYVSAYEYLKSKERVFTLTHLKNPKDVKKFSSPKAAIGLGWSKQL